MMHIVAFLQCTNAGKILQTRQERVNLRLTEATYRNALASGLSRSRKWVLEPGAEQLHIGVCDGTSDSIGSVTVPLTNRQF